jgi:hypothetical protein
MSLTLIIAAPRASVEAPPKAATMRHACKTPKFGATADPTVAPNKIKDETTKTGRLPRYSANGTHKKF